MDDGWGEIFYSQQMNNEVYHTGEKLDVSINTSGYESSPLISSDGNILIFYRRDKMKNPGLYISKRQKDGLWGIAQKLNVFENKKALSFSASFSPDRTQLYILFRRMAETSKNFKEGIYQVNTSILLN